MPVAPCCARSAALRELAGRVKACSQLRSEHMRFAGALAPNACLHPFFPPALQAIVDTVERVLQQYIDQKKI